MVAFPVIKLVGLVIKQMSKPLANLAKRKAKDDPFFRVYFCIPPAQLYHWCEVRMKMYIMDIGKSSSNTQIPKLNEQAAIELGGNLLGEGVIFVVAVGVLIFEVSRQKGNDKSKEQEEKDNIYDIISSVNDLKHSNKELNDKIKQLNILVDTISRSNKSVQTISSTPISSDKSMKSGTIATAIEDAQLSILKR